MDMDKARFNMVEQQIRPWDVLDPKILDLFMSIPRHNFVTEQQQILAYSDIELPLNSEQSMLSPKVEARLLQAVDVDENEIALEIGTGSGFMTAILASSAKSVTTVEISAEIQQQAKLNLKDFNNINFELGDGAVDWDDGKQYDVIVLGGATAEQPNAYKNKLTLGGRLVATIGKSPAMTSTLFTRVSPTEWETETLFETVIPNLVNAEAKTNFSF